MSTEIPPLLSRRCFVACVVLNATSLGTIPLVAAQGTALPHLDPADPVAKALAYSENAAKVDPKAESLFKAANHCGNCKLFQAVQAKGDSAPCLIFPGKSVNVNGWCRAWAAKT
jgi:High potential iron-sulfur protein